MDTDRDAQVDSILKAQAARQLASQQADDYREIFCSRRLLARATFDSFEADSIEKQNALSVARSFASDLPNQIGTGGSLLLFGTIGTGKTHLAACVAKACIAAGFRTAWQTGANLFMAMRGRIAAGDPEAALVAKLVRVQVLIVDDIAPPSAGLTDYQRSVLLAVVNGRYEAQRSTIVTANVADEGDASARLGNAVVDRLLDRSYVIPMRWESYRRPKAIGPA